MNFIADLDRGAIRHQHPHGDLQPFSASIDDRDCTISPLGPADDLKSRTMKRMERIENLDLVAFREQGIVGADVTILTFTTSFLALVWLPMALSGYTAPSASFCLSLRSAASSTASSQRLSTICFGTANSSSTARSSRSPRKPLSVTSFTDCSSTTGWSMSIRPSADGNRLS